jgi:hypothetical protein
MQNLSSWQGYGCLTHVCTGVYILQCWIDSHWLLVQRYIVSISDSQLLKLFCSFLGLFAPVHAQDVQIRSTAHRVLPAAPLFLKQYHNIRFSQQKR